MRGCIPVRALVRIPSVALGLALLVGACGADGDAVEQTVDQVASSPREDHLPSALDDVLAPGLPRPLVDPAALRPGGPPPDGIPAIDDPVFQSVATVDWLEDPEAVIAVEIDGDARAYPIQILTWHELVNDTVAGVPVTLSYCPLCNSAIMYDRRLGERVLDFGTSGSLYHSSLVMYDRQTESLWTHFDGTAVAGVLTGSALTTLPVATTSWDDFRRAFPDGRVLTRTTGHSRDYGRNPYVGYDDAGERPFLFEGAIDDRLEPKARVVVVRADGEPAVALPRGELVDDGVVEFRAHGRDLVAVLDTGTASPLDRAAVAAGYDQGAVAVFVDALDGAELSLSRVEGGFRDSVSGTTFDVFGRPVAPTAGAAPPGLEPVEHLDTFWFAIAAFDEAVEIIGG